MFAGKIYIYISYVVIPLALVNDGKKFQRFARNLQSQLFFALSYRRLGHSFAVFRVTRKRKIPQPVRETSISAPLEKNLLPAVMRTHKQYHNGGRSGKSVIQGYTLTSPFRPRLFSFSSSIG